VQGFFTLPRCCGRRARSPLEAAQDRWNRSPTVPKLSQRVRATSIGGWGVWPVIRLSGVGVARQDQGDAGAPLPRLALSKAEAAAALGVSVDFLEQHVMSELRIVRRGRRRLIPISELERWLESNATLAIDPGWTNPRPIRSAGSRAE